jgi:peroxiredoxin Q/BCP
MGAEQSSKSEVKTGDPAPDFSLPDQNGQTVSLRDLVSKKIVVLYFYPADFSRGCTAEACSFRDSYEVFKEAGAEVVGVSSQSVDSHRRFAAENTLPFILLSDQNGEVRKLYGVSSSLGLIPGRVTYIIDKRGIVRHMFSSQLNPTKHVEEALRVLKEISNEPSNVKEG